MTLREMEHRKGTVLLAPGVLATAVDVFCRYAAPRTG